MKAVKAVKAAIGAIEEVRYWSFQENGSLAAVDIGVYVDNAEQVGSELIRYDGVIEGAVEGSMGYESKGWDAWNKILDKNFGEFEWEHPAHFAVSVYDIDSADGEQAEQLADQFNAALKKRDEPVYYVYGHLDVVYMVQKQEADDAFAIKYKGDKIAEALIAAQQ